MGDESRSDVLLELLQAAGSGRDIGEVIDGIGEQLSRLIEFDRLSVILPEPGSDIIVSHAFTTDSVGARLRLPMADTSASRVMAGECFILDIETSPYASERALAAELGLRTAIYAPLVTGERVVGFLAISSLEPNAYDENARSCAEEVGRYLGVVIENASLLARADVAEDLTRRLQLAQSSHQRLASRLAELIWQIHTDAHASDEQVRTMLAEVRRTL